MRLASCDHQGPNMHDLAILGNLLRRRLPDTSPVGLLKTFPGSILLFSVVVSCGLSTRHLSIDQYRPVLNTFGLDYDITKDSHLLHIFTPLFIQPSPGIGWKMVCMIAFSCVMCELLAGSKRMIATFFLSDWCATILTSAILGGLSHFNVERATDAITLPMRAPPLQPLAPWLRQRHSCSLREWRDSPMVS